VLTSLKASYRVSTSEEINKTQKQGNLYKSNNDDDDDDNNNNNNNNNNSINTNQSHH
jgi:hypothetical protein